MTALERGSITPLAVAAVSVVCALAVSVAAAGGYAASAARAQGIADAAAIAGAQAARDSRARGLGVEGGCAAAGEVVRANGAVLVACRATARGDIRVEVAIRIGGAGEVKRASRAGTRAAP